MLEIILVPKETEAKYPHEIDYFDNLLWVRYGTSGVCGVGIITEAEGPWENDQVYNMPLWSNNDSLCEKTTRHILSWNGVIAECITKALHTHNSKIFQFDTPLELLQYAAKIIAEAEARENNPD